MAENVVRDEVLYTYDAAVQRYEQERYHAWLCRQKRLEAIRHEQKARRKYFCKQRLVGLIMVVTITFLTLLIGDPVCAILAVPGIWIMRTNKMVIVDDYYRTHGGAAQWGRR